MRQDEILEISSAFLDAWTDFFGTSMEYIPLSTETNFNSIYGESKTKTYDEKKAVTFYGTISEQESLEKTSPYGKNVERFFNITFVTQELVDKGVTLVDSNSIIRYTDRFGKVFNLEIFDDYQKVQFSDNKIFTKLKVRYSG